MAYVLKRVYLRRICRSLFIQVILRRILISIEVGKSWDFEHLLKVDVDIIVLGYDMLKISRFFIIIAWCLVDGWGLALLARVHLSIEIYNYIGVVAMPWIVVHILLYLLRSTILLESGLP